MVIGLALWPEESHDWLVMSLSSLEKVKITRIGLHANESMLQLNLLVIDGDAPGPHFLTYLSKLSKNPEIIIPPMIIIGGPTSPIMRSLDWENADIVFIAKPYEIENVRSVVENKIEEINQAVIDHASSKIKPIEKDNKSLGYLSTLRLSDLVQMLCLNLWTGKIMITHLLNDETGEVFIDSGKLIHAAASQKVGDEAFYIMLKWGRSEFNFEEGLLSQYISIKSDWQELILEGARQIDENAPDN
ncbi:MAG: DUF4388 domain-containing protein [Verrucomicrobiota bacterium]